jgi:hypothetical protein
MRLAIVALVVTAASAVLAQTVNRAAQMRISSKRSRR